MQTSVLGRKEMSATNSSLPWVLLIRDDSPYSTGFYLERALEKKCNTISLRLSDENYSIMRWAFGKLRKKFLDLLLNKIFQLSVGYSIPKIDLVWVVDSVRRKVESKEIPTVYYAIDSHTAFHEHIRFARVQDYDFVFVAQKDDVCKYENAGCKRVYWLPLACDPEIHKRHDLDQKYDVCFIGKVWRGHRREQIIKVLQKKFNVFIGKAFLHDMAQMLSQSKMGLNISHAGDLNMRVFEVMSCGRLLLTDHIGNGLEELFANGKHLVIYEDVKDLIEKIQYYLENPEEREKIAIRGQREVHRKHKYEDRVEKVLDIVLSSNTQ